MSGQDVGFFNVGAACPDLVVENGDLKADNGLETAALISLFSDKRVTFEQLPDGDTDRRGWWADLISEPLGDEIGSRLWTLERSKVLQTAAVDMESILTEAFNWLIEDGVSSSVVVNSSLTDDNTLEGSAEIFKPNGQNIPFKFIWDGQRLKLLES